MTTTHLFNIDLPPEVTFQSGEASGSNVTCLDCGLDWETAEDEDSTVWSYAVDNEGIGVWVKATCNGCGRVEIFTTPGGKASGYARELRDLDRKHREMHGEWRRDQVLEERMSPRAWHRPRETTFEVYDIRKKWRKFRRHLTHRWVIQTENRAMKALRADYDSTEHIPREAGRCLDVPWPLSRTGAMAYQCFGHCHAIAPVMCALARRAEPTLYWAIVGHTEHTVVIGGRRAVPRGSSPKSSWSNEPAKVFGDCNHIPIGAQHLYVLDINMVGHPSDEIIPNFMDTIWNQPGRWATADLDDYIRSHLVADGAYPFRHSAPMSVSHRG